MDIIVQLIAIFLFLVAFKNKDFFQAILYNFMIIAENYYLIFGFHIFVFHSNLFSLF